MSTRAIDAARSYIVEAQGRGVGALSTDAVALRIGVNDSQAIALINCLAETEGLVRIQGFVSCPDCLEQLAVRGQTLAAITREAERLAGTRCQFCDTDLPSASDIKIGLLFFCVATGENEQSPVAVSTTANKGALGVTANLEQLRQYQGIQCHNLILASEGASVLVGETVKQSGSLISMCRTANQTDRVMIKKIYIPSPQDRADAFIRRNP